uniref:Uncharacterized protein n=1 Tax=Poecilia reticulata TaxID=8081 RepID=A0A3P9Q3R0_POERE
EPNLTEAEFSALAELIDNHEIVIKPADKGSAIVILDRRQYLWECYRQLSDPNYYLKLSKPIYLETLQIVAKILNRLHKNKFISAKQKSYLLGPLEPRPRLFYVLPKVHKEPFKWSVPFKVPPGRPIVSDCSSETYGTIYFILYFLGVSLFSDAALGNCPFSPYQKSPLHLEKMFYCLKTNMSEDIQEDLRGFILF